MNFNDLSFNAQFTIMHMVQHCLELEHCLGPDGGFDPETDEPSELRKELSEFVKPLEA